jgi:hypothetical protein
VTFAWDRSSASGQATVAVNPTTGARYVFWQGPDGFIQEAWSGGVSWSGPVKMTSWGRSGSSPSVAIGNNNHQFVFWRGASGHILEAWYQGRSWHGPRDMTNALDWPSTNAAPAVAINPVNNHQFVFWRGTDGAIRQAWWDGRWHGPVNTRWKASSAPSVAVANDSHQYVFWTGAKGHLEEAWYGRHWNGPVDMTTSAHWPTASGAPAVAVNASTDHQYVFWRDGHGHIEQAVATERGWRSPQDMTVEAGWGQSLSALSAAVTNNYSQYVFWRATAGNIREAQYQGAWQTVDLNWR